MTINDHIVNLKIVNLQNTEIKNTALYLKRRLTEQLWQYSDKEIRIGDIKEDGSLSAAIPFDVLRDKSEVQYFDLILTQVQGNMSAEYFLYLEKEIPIGNIIACDCNDNNSAMEEKLELYYSAGKNVSLKFYSKERFESNVERLNVQDGIIRIILSKIGNERNDYKNKKIVMQKRTYKNIKKYCSVWKKDICLKETAYIFETTPEDLLKGCIKTCNEFWDVFIESENQLFPIRCDDSIKTGYFDIGGGFKVCFFCNSEKKLAVYTHEGNHQENKKTNIAVLGTCFARSVFKSDPYFNPDYKRFYDCVYTQFHSSIISMTSQKWESYENKDDWNKEALRYLPTEFNKDFFDKLKESKAEYLLLDNYIDATRPIIDVGNGIYITHNKYLIKSNMIRDLVNCRIIKPGTEEYYGLYRKHAKIFIDEVKKCMSEDHIILLQGRFSYFKVDEKTNIKSEWEGKPYIQRNNIRWDKVDHIFRSLAPKARIIDMRDTQYVSDVKSPIPGGASPSHYQRYYYREILDKINKIILEDKVARGTSE